MGYNIKIERDGSVFVKDRQGNELVRGTDYIIENPDVKEEISIEQSNGAIVYISKDQTFNFFL